MDPRRHTRACLLALVAALIGVGVAPPAAGAPAGKPPPKAGGKPGAKPGAKPGGGKPSGGKPGAGKPGGGKPGAGKPGGKPGGAKLGPLLAGTPARQGDPSEYHTIVRDGLKYDVMPAAEAFPAFFTSGAVFNVTKTFPSRSAAQVWEQIKSQRKLISSMPCRVESFNGPYGAEEMIVIWETPTDWHRWTRLDVRKYVSRSDATMTNAFFLVGGFGLWLPRLAFRETVVATGPTSSLLHVGVWYEMDEKYIGWDSTNLRRLTVTRWDKFYHQYSETIRRLITAVHGVAPPPQAGRSEL